MAVRGRRNPQSFARVKAGPGARKAEARAKAMSGEIKTILDRFYQMLVDQAVAGVKSVVRKANTFEQNRERLADQLATILARGGVRFAEDSLSRLGDEYEIPPTFYEDYYAQKKVEAQGLLAEIETEFQTNMGRQIGQWVTDTPGITLAELTRRIKLSTYVAGAEVLKPGQAPSVVSLQPLEDGPPVTRDPWSRANLIARTEMTQASNSGSYAALEAAGVEYVEWSSQLSDGGRGHQEMDGEIVRIGTPFVLPDGTRMLYPGDPGAPIGHTANCRCSITAASMSDVLRLRGGST